MNDSAKPVVLEVKDLAVNYGMIKALHGISLKIRKGDIVTLIGANGAGKTTTLRTISGLLRAKSGNVFFNGQEITSKAPHKIVQLGLAQVPEGRMVFANLSVRDNLEMGAFLRSDRAAIKQDFDLVYSMFPR